MRRTTALLVVGVLAAGCSSGGDDIAEVVDVGETTSDTTNATVPDTAPATEPAGDDEGAGGSLAPDASVEEALAVAPVPAEAAPEAEQPCERWGYACDPLAVPEEVLDRTLEAMGAVSAAMDASDDAREQLRLGLVALNAIEGVGHVEADLDTATMLAFTVDGGPRAAVMTSAGELQEGDEVAPVDEAFVPPPDEATADAAQGFAGTGFRSVEVRPERYEPAGGPAVRRSAAIFNPFEWASGGEIAAIFRAEDEYTRVDVFDGPAVTPWTVDTAGSYDAVHIITHGGGSCPSWTDDRSECTSTFVGGEFTIESANAAQAAADASVGVDFFLCESGGTNRYCFNSNAFPSNPNGIVFFNSCGSDFGFNTTGAGASVGWTGTTQRRVAERTALRFWELMVTDGVEFELAQQVVQGGGYDSHTSTYWASVGAVNPFTSAAFQGRNLRARDVVEMRLDGAEPQGQVLQFNGLPGDANAETFPAKDQQITFTVEGVRSGSEGGVTIEVRGDGTLWPSDIKLGRDGSVLEQKDGFATWQVTLDADAVEIPDLAWTDLSPTRAPVELEIRAFQNAGEYTAYKGSVRLGTDVEFTGSLPIFDQLEAGMPSNGALEGNDLRVMINTGTGELTGTMTVTMIASGLTVGSWQLDLTGTYDPDSGAVEGEVVGASEGGIFDIRASDSGSGTFQGQANLPSESIQIQLGIGGQSQTYSGTIVR